MWRGRERLRLVTPQSSITWHIAISMVGTEPLRMPPNMLFGSKRLLPVESLVLNTTCRNYISMVHTVCRRTMRSISVGQKKSANNGYTPACYNLGLYYENIDREEAFYWYKMDMDLHWQEHHEEDQFAVDRLQAMGITYHPADHASSGSDRNTSSRSLTNGKSKKIISSH